MFPLSHSNHDARPFAKKTLFKDPIVDNISTATMLCPEVAVKKIGKQG